MRIDSVTTAAEVGQTESGQLGFAGLAGGTTPIDGEFPCEGASVQLRHMLDHIASFTELGATIAETGNPVPHIITWSVTDPEGGMTTGEWGPLRSIGTRPLASHGLGFSHDPAAACRVGPRPAKVPTRSRSKLTILSRGSCGITSFG